MAHDNGKLKVGDYTHRHDKGLMQLYRYQVNASGPGQDGPLRRSVVPAIFVKVTMDLDLGKA